MTVKEKLLRKTSIVIGLIILIGGFYLSFKIASPAEAEKTAAVEVSKKLVEVIPVKNTTVDIPIITTGTIKASQSIDIYADVQGTLKTASKAFKTGMAYRKGAVLLAIDDKEARLNLQTKKSDFFSLLLSILPDIESDYSINMAEWKAYIDAFDINKNIPELPEPQSDKEKYYLASKKIEYQYLGIKKEELTLSKYKVYAPFTGILDEVYINPGALVRTGQKLGTFINTNRFELEISIPSSSVNTFKIGTEVTISSDDHSKTWKGSVQRISKTIDENTQTLTVYVSLSGEGLYQGMYLNAAIKSTPIENAFVINRSLINHDKTLYVIENNEVAIIQPQIVKYTGDQVIIKGIPDGTNVLASKFKGIYQGMQVELK